MPLLLSHINLLIGFFIGYVLCFLFMSNKWNNFLTQKFYQTSSTSVSDGMRLEQIPRPSRYSSFECTAGNQRFLEEEFALQGTQEPSFPSAGNIQMRTCLFRNVCIKNESLTFFLDDDFDKSIPPLFRLSAFNQSHGILFKDRAPPYSPGMFFRGYLGQQHDEPVVPTIVHGKMPESFKILDKNRVYILDELSFGYNYGHMIIDSILPAFSIADVYGFDMASVQLVGWRSCETLEFDIDPKPCRANMARWMNNFFDHPYLEPSKETVCFSQLLVGQSGSMALNGLYLHRSVAIRKARLRLHRRLGVSFRRNIFAHTIVVHNKRQMVFASQFPSLCNNVKLWASQLFPQPLVICSWTADLDPKLQLRLINNATVTIAEHGSTNYLSLFQMPGSSLIMLVPYRSWAKEPQVLLFNTDVQAFYISDVAVNNYTTGGSPPFEKLYGRDEGPGVLLLALENAAVRMNLPKTYLKSNLNPTYPS